MSRPYSISTDQAMLDLKWVVGFIRASYWGPWQTEAAIDAAIKNSLCFGLYVNEGAYQIGFARVVTDHAVFSAVTDVFIRADYRHKGYGTRLMEAVLVHPAVRDGICILDCRPENQPFYERLGFERKRAIMQRDPI